VSLAIDIDKVSQVLLADGWHDVSRSSFDLDSYEFVQNVDDDGPLPHGSKAESLVLLAGGKVQGIPSTGATWRESDGSKMYCPVTAVLAVRVVPHRITPESVECSDSEQDAHIGK